jgi:hypothetical protein
MGVGSLSDWIVLVLARRNKGYKEPEMRIWAYIFPFCFAAIGYFTYGWAATNGDAWISIAIGLCCLIAHQVSITSLATAYAMECFDGVCPFIIPLYITQIFLLSNVCLFLDIRRARRRTGHLFVFDQLCHLVFGAAVHQ